MLKKFLVMLSDESMTMEGDRKTIISALLAALDILDNDMPGTLKEVSELLMEESIRKENKQ